jgi:hypothetical protein
MDFDDIISAIHRGSIQHMLDVKLGKMWTDMILQIANKKGGEKDPLPAEIGINTNPLFVP